MEIEIILQLDRQWKGIAFAYLLLMDCSLAMVTFQLAVKVRVIEIYCYFICDLVISILFYLESYDMNYQTHYLLSYHLCKIHHHLHYCYIFQAKSSFCLNLSEFGQWKVGFSSSLVIFVFVFDWEVVAFYVLKKYLKFNLCSCRRCHHLCWIYCLSPCMNFRRFLSIYLGLFTFDIPDTALI